MLEQQHCPALSICLKTWDGVPQKNIMALFKINQGLPLLHGTLTGFCPLACAGHVAHTRKVSFNFEQFACFSICLQQTQLFRYFQSPCKLPKKSYTCLLAGLLGWYTVKVKCKLMITQPARVHEKHELALVDIVALTKKNISLIVMSSRIEVFKQHNQGHPGYNIIYLFSLSYGLLLGLGSLLRVFCFLCFSQLEVINYIIPEIL